MKKAFQFLIIVLVVLGCKGKHNATERSATIILNADSLQNERLRYSIIHDAKQASIIYDGHTTLWTPTKEQIGQVFLLTKEAILENEDKRSKYLRADSLQRSYKQLICYVDSKGDSIVFVNGLCVIGDYPTEDSTGKLSSYREDWQNKLIMVKDGGDCYWQAYINFSKRKVVTLNANGEA